MRGRRRDNGPRFRVTTGFGPKRLVLVAAATSALLLPRATAHAAEGWRIDEAHTAIGFKVEAVGFPTTRGHFTHYSGRILIDLDHPAKSFTSFTVDAASVDVGSPSF